jgi:hypothetical protein
MAYVSVLGTSDSRLGNLILAIGAKIPEPHAAWSEMLAADAASANVVQPIGVQAGAEDSLTLTDVAAVGYGYRNCIAWMGPGQLVAFSDVGQGFVVPRAVMPWKQRAICLDGTCYFSSPISREYRGTGLAIRVYWLGSPNAGFTAATLALSVWPAPSGAVMPSVDSPSKVWSSTQTVQLPAATNTIAYTDFDFQPPDPSGIAAGSSVFLKMTFTPQGNYGVAGSTYSARMPFVFLGASLTNR